MTRKGQFTSENQPKKGRGRSERTKILDAIKRQSRTEEEFYDIVVQRVFNPDDNIAFNEVLKRLSPIPKAVAPFIEFKLTEEEPHKKAFQIMDGIAESKIPPDIGVMLITAIKSTVDIEEYTDLKERIEKLEAIISGS